MEIKKFQISFLLTLIWLLQLTSISLNAQSLTRYEFAEVHMGTLFRIVLYAESAHVADEASQRAFNRVKELNHVFSDYLEDSELSRISQQASRNKMNVSAEMWQLLNLSKEFHEQSNGSFNIAMGPLTKLWRRAIRRQEMPMVENIKDALSRSCWCDVRLDEKTQSISLKNENMRLDMGGIAKGYAIDEAYKALLQQGISIALVDGGGDVYAGEQPPGKEGWQVTLTKINGTEDILISNEAIASSGSTYRFLNHQGRVYSHIIDPHSGYGISDPQIINVKASSCVVADASATALSVMSLEKEMMELEQHFGIKVLR